MAMKSLQVVAIGAQVSGKGRCVVNLIKAECQVGSCDSQDSQNISTLVSKKIQIAYLHCSNMQEGHQSAASSGVCGNCLHVQPRGS